MRGRLEARDIGPYVLAQLFGAILGGNLCYFFNGETFAPSPGAGGSLSQAMTAEVVFRFLQPTRLPSSGKRCLAFPLGVVQGAFGALAEA